MILYKIKAKLLTNKMYFLLHSIISPEQNAFIKGRSISRNILIVRRLYITFKGLPLEKDLLYLIQIWNELKIVFVRIFFF